jgi:hypothetical protein
MIDYAQYVGVGSRSPWNGAARTEKIMEVMTANRLPRLKWDTL